MDVTRFDWEEHIRHIAYSGLYGASNGDYRWTLTMLRHQRERQAILDITDTDYDRRQSDAISSTLEATLNEWFEGTGFYFLHGLHMMLHTYTMTTLAFHDGPEDEDLCLATLMNYGELSLVEAGSLFPTLALESLRSLGTGYRISAIYGIVTCENECSVFDLQVTDRNGNGLQSHSTLNVRVTVGEGRSTFLNFVWGITTIWNIHFSHTLTTHTEDSENLGFDIDNFYSTDDVARG